MTPNMNKMNHEIRCPASDKRYDYTKGHFNGFNFRTWYGFLIAHSLPQGATRPFCRYVLSLLPNNTDDVYVAEWYKNWRYDEDIRRQGREIQLALPPCGVALTHTFVHNFSIGVDPRSLQAEYEQLWAGECERHSPCDDDHSTGTRTGGAKLEGFTDGHVAVETHGGQNEGRAGQGHDLDVDDDLARDLTHDPRVAENAEQDLRGHGKATHAQVSDRQVYDEYVDAAVQFAVFAAAQDDNDDKVPEESQRHDEDQGRHTLDHFRCPWDAILYRF